MKKDKRFELVYDEGSSLSDDGLRKVFVDKETGVCYLTWKSGYAGGITPLLDSEGKPVIMKSEQQSVRRSFNASADFFCIPMEIFQNAV